MAVENTGIISTPQCTVVLLKFSKETFSDVQADKILDLLVKNKIKGGGESPISGFSEIAYDVEKIIYARTI